MIEGRHPKLHLGLDSPPVAYCYDEHRHGPSRGTQAARRLTRRLIARIEPWAEEPLHGAPLPALPAEVTDDDYSAEAEAAAFFAQEEYWASLSYDPFEGAAALQQDCQEDDAEGFWSAIPAELPIDGQADSQGCESFTPVYDPPVSNDDDMAIQLFGCPLDKEAKSSRRKATVERQGSEFWGNLEEFALPAAHRRRIEMADLAAPSTDALFTSEGADPCTGLKEVERASLVDSNRAKAELCRRRKAEIE